MAALASSAADADSASSDSDDYFSPDLFVDTEYVSREFAMPDGSSQPILGLASASTDFDLTGQIVWPVSVLLARYVVDRVRPAGQRVLELGSGCGLSGLAASSCGAASVTLSDGNDVVLSLVSRRPVA